jgi:hypothetical protein
MRDLASIAAGPARFAKMPAYFVGMADAENLMSVLPVKRSGGSSK